MMPIINNLIEPDQLVNKLILTNGLTNFALIGYKGVGKKNLAYNLAKTINCNSLNSCNICPNCLAFNNFSHPNFLHLNSKKNAILIDDIRELNQLASKSLLFGNYRLIYIEQAELMTFESANSFLKTLEEHPPFIIFILGIVDSQKLIATIESRLIKVYMPPLNDEFVKKQLTTKYNFNLQQVEQYGSLFKMGLNDDWLNSLPEFLQFRLQLLSLVEKIAELSNIEIINIIPKLIKSPFCDELGIILLSYYRDLLFIQNNINTNLINKWSNFNYKYISNVQFNYIFDICALIIDFERSLDTKSNKSLIVENLFLNIKIITNLQVA